MAQEKLLISPQVSIIERELLIRNRRPGLTSLGVVGEFPQGPAFQPIFTESYDQQVNIFGGLNPERFKSSGYPKYEGGYIAKSFLQESNQMFVTRVLGLTGYDAKTAWSVTVNAGPDESTLTPSVFNIGPNTFSGDTGNVTPTLFATLQFNSSCTILSGSTFQESDLQNAFNGNNNRVVSFFSSFCVIPQGEGIDTNGDLLYIPATSNTFFGYDLTLEVTSVLLGSNGSRTITLGYTRVAKSRANKLSGMDNMVVATLRTRGDYDSNEVVQPYVLPGSLSIDSSFGTASTNALSDFRLFGTTSPFSNAATLSGSVMVGVPFEYMVSLDKTKKNFISKLMGKNQQDEQKGPIYVDEVYAESLARLISENKIYGLNLVLNQIDNLDNYEEQFKPAITPWVLSEVRGNKVMRLFRFITISDGDSANRQVKISIQNIRPDNRTFDVIVRRFNDRDDAPQVIEEFNRCTMTFGDKNYIGAKIGTLDGTFPLRSQYIVLDIATGDLTEAIPAGFDGFQQREYIDNNSNTLSRPLPRYKTKYSTLEKKRKFFLGISDTVGIDVDFFNYKGLKSDGSEFITKSKGFHLDKDANNTVIEFFVKDANGSLMQMTENYNAEVGEANFRTEADLDNTVYQQLTSRKFTLAPQGGFDGWDVYRRERTITDTYRLEGFRSSKGLLSGTFKARSASDGRPGTTSDYYAYLEAALTMKNVAAVSINLLATPNLDLFNTPSLVDDVIELVEEERGDVLYIVTTPDTDKDGSEFDPSDVVTNLGDSFDSSYTATYYPWIQLNDTENNLYIFVPPTAEVARAFAFTDKVTFPWFANAGLNRGLVNAIKARRRLDQDTSDILYDNRINPMVTFINEGVVIFGNKTLKLDESPLNRVNVRRLLIQTKRLIRAVSNRLLFDQNDLVVRKQFLDLVNPILEGIKRERGLQAFRVVVNDDPALLEQRRLDATIYLRPTEALEYITIALTVTNDNTLFEEQ